jgi:uncharacterized protein involved in type VI secretion and phage assembly
VNRLFEFQVDVLTGMADFDPNVLIGEEITLGLLQADGSRRKSGDEIAAQDDHHPHGGIAWGAT